MKKSTRSFLALVGILLTIFLLSGCGANDAANIPVPDGLHYRISNGKVTITGYSGRNMDLVIPSKIEGYPVTSIEKEAFQDHRYLNSVTIPNSVTSIGDYAFYCCESLTRINFPDGVTSIGDHAFDNCWNLTSINIPDGVTSIGYMAFYNCFNATSITIPDSVTFIGDHAFYDSESLTSIKVKEGSYAHQWCIDNYFENKVWFY